MKSKVLKGVISKFEHERQKFATTTRTGRFTRELDHALPGKHTKNLYDTLTRDQAAVLSQLRTGKNKPNYYLAKAKMVESETCECKREPETVSHFMLRCPRWTTERAKMQSAVQKRTGDLSFLLGGWDPRTNPDREKWHPDLAAVGAAIQFVKETDRFEEEAPKRP